MTQLRIPAVYMRGGTSKGVFLRHLASSALVALLLAIAPPTRSQPAEKLVEISTRPGVTQKMLVIAPADARATVVLFAGGHGGLQFYPNGSMKYGEGNFLVRTRQQFVAQGLMTIVVDAPSDRQSPPFLSGFRQRPEHVADVKAVIRWARETAKVPVWLIGTSRGTQSAAFVATELAGAEGPDGIVLTSTILTDVPGSRPVPEMPLEKIRVPVLVVHHELDGCRFCSFGDIPGLMNKLAGAPRAQLLSFKGGDTRGDACEAFAYHGFNGLEGQVVQQIAGWMLAGK
jgi:pimeloyl-ACP methyl ester carboxylesterase